MRLFIQAIFSKVQINLICIVIIFNCNCISQTAPTLTINTNHCNSILFKKVDKEDRGYLSLSANAKDNITSEDQLQWEYKVDLYGDNKGSYNGYDIYVGPLSKEEFKAGKIPKNIDNPFSQNPTNPFDASAYYPLGKHVIYWKVTNSNGLSSSNISSFVIEDCIAPIPYCLTGLNTVLLQSPDGVEIVAQYFNNGSTDNLTSRDNLKFYFNGDSSLTSIRITCNDFIKAQEHCRELKLELELWVEDNNGNKDYCKTYVNIVDVNQLCPIECYAGKIFGKINDLDCNKVIADILLFREGRLIEVTSESEYSFNYLPPTHYKISPMKSDDHLNGITSIDVKKINDFLLNKIKIRSQLYLIAADVNNSKSVTQADVSELRKLILGEISEFTKNRSWRFFLLSKNQNFQNVWNIPQEDSVLLDFSKKAKEVNFTAVKIGSFRHADQECKKSPTIRSNSELIFNCNMELDSRNLLLKLNISAPDFNSIEAFQTGWKFDESVMQYFGWEAGKLPLQDSNFGLSQKKNGRITQLWFDEEGLTYSSNDKLFTLIFKVRNLQRLEKLLKGNDYNSFIELDESITSSKAYNKNIEEIGIVLNHRLSFDTLNDIGCTLKSDRNLVEIKFSTISNKTTNIRLVDLFGRILKEKNTFVMYEGETKVIQFENLVHPAVLILEVIHNNTKFTDKLMFP
ncbi:MAG: hypothetical protein HOP11_10145 [Saprospiraceae bacterium]|nr:hypothetical protein [Saprospiraceae bacterium]